MRLAISWILALTAVLVAGCTGDDGSSLAAPSTGSGTISVAKGSVVIGDFAVSDAFARASKEAGYQVLPVGQLPKGFRTDSISVANPPGGVQTPLRRVEISIRSDSGGAMISELNSRAEPGPDAIRINSSNPDDYFASPDSKTYARLTSDRTYTLLLPSANLGQAEAVEVLNSIR